MQPDINRPVPPQTRIPPIEIAPDTFVISNHVGEGVAPQIVHMNSMVIRAAEPVVVDCGAPIHRDQYLEDLFSLVDPDDVRWVFLSHEDIDHFGNVEAVMAACTHATLVASWFLCERLAAGGLAVPPTRWRWVGHGETLDVGDRTLVALRPPVYDSPVTRGLFDPTTGAYWASDAFATPVPQPSSCISELDPEEWAGGFMAFQTWNSPWAQMLDEAKFLREVSALERLGIRSIATCHGPSIPQSHVARAFELMAQVPSVPDIPQPGQPLLDEIVSQMLATA